MSIDLKLHIILWPSGYKSINQKCFLVILLISPVQASEVQTFGLLVKENLDYEI